MGTATLLGFNLNGIAPPNSVSYAMTRLFSLWLYTSGSGYIQPGPLFLASSFDMPREGFPDWEPTQFVEFLCQKNRCQPDALVTRIEFRYLPPAN